MDARLPFRARLIAAGHLVPTGVDGLYGRSDAFEAVAGAVGRAIDRLCADDGAERMHFTPAMPRIQLERTGYMKSFPQLAGVVRCFCGDERAHRELLRRIGEGDDWGEGLGASDIALIPAACYPVYPAVAARGSLPQAGLRVDLVSWCFRHEPSLQPTRMQMFRQHEHVQLGTAEHVSAFRTAWMARAEALMTALRLPYEIDVANDPFFGRGGKLVADNQRSQTLKFELLTPVNEDDAPTACASFNNHLEHFGETWGVRTADGAVAHTGCCGFGLERMTLALMRHHGLEPRGWPAAVRATLWP